MMPSRPAQVALAAKLCQNRRVALDAVLALRPFANELAFSTCSTTVNLKASV